MTPSTPSSRGGSARSFAEILGNRPAAKARRTGQPVRRNSYHVGEREHRHWRPVPRREHYARLAAAEAYNREHKKTGAPNGPLGHVGLEVLKFLYRLACRKTGRLEPSIDYMMRGLRRSRAAIVRALAALREHGFLDWIRRTVPIEAEGPGPRVRQTSNAYWFGLPAKALALVHKIIGRGPTPDDDDHRRQSDRDEAERMLSTIPLDELARMRVENPQLAEALARLGRSVERASASSPGGLNPGMEGSKG